MSDSTQHENEANADGVQAALDLPREIEPPRGMWPAVQARIEAKRRVRRVVRRSAGGASILLAAAAVILSVRAARHPHGDGAAAITRDSVAGRELAIRESSESMRRGSTAEREPRLPSVPAEDSDEVVPEEASYRAALSALMPTFEEGVKTLTEKDRNAVGSSLEALDAAILLTRASLVQHPDDADLRAELDAEYEQKIDALNDVLAWTTRS